MLLPGEALASESFVRESAEVIVGSGNELSLNGGGLTDELKDRTLSCSKCCKEAYCVSRI
jgi:hypothetical protein